MTIIAGILFSAWTAFAPAWAESPAAAPAPASPPENAADPIVATLKKAAASLAGDKKKEETSAEKQKAQDSAAQSANESAEIQNTLNRATSPPPSSNTSPIPSEMNVDQRSKAFEGALNNIFPMTPQQIQEVMRRMNEAQDAGRAPPEPDPNPIVKIEDVPLDPGVAPPVIRVAIGYVTTVNILDVTGQPWPIQDVVVGGNFQVTGPNDAHVLRLIPQTRFGRGNLSVRLVGLSTPITFRVESGGKEVYYRYDARITQTGPDAKQPLIDKGFTGQAGDPTLMTVLSGIAPKDAKKLGVSGADGRTRAWKINDLIYLRTPLTLLSPGWDASVRSADGTNVYVLQETPVLMLSDNGQMVRGRLEIPPDDPFHTADLKDGKITLPVANTPDTPPVVTKEGTDTVAPAATAPAPGVLPLAGQEAVNAATQPPAGGSIANEAAQQFQAAVSNNTQRRNNSGVQIYTGGAVPQKTGSNVNIQFGGGS